MNGHWIGGTRKFNKHWQSGGEHRWFYGKYNSVRFQGIVKDGEPYIFPMAWYMSDAVHDDDDWQKYGYPNAENQANFEILQRANLYGVNPDDVLANTPFVDGWYVTMGNDSHQYLEVYGPVECELMPCYARATDDIIGSGYPMRSGTATFFHYRYDRTKHNFVSYESGIPGDQIGTGTDGDKVSVTINYTDKIGILGLNIVKYYVLTTVTTSNDKGYQAFDARNVKSWDDMPLMQIRYHGIRFADYQGIDLRKMEPLCSGGHTGLDSEHSKPDIMYGTVTDKPDNVFGEYRLGTPIAVGNSYVWGEQPTHALAQGYETRYVRNVTKYTDCSAFIPYVYLAGSNRYCTQVADAGLYMRNGRGYYPIPRNNQLLKDNDQRLCTLMRPVGLTYYHDTLLDPEYAKPDDEYDGN